MAGELAVGVDGFRGAWAAVALRNRECELAVFPRIEDLCRHWAEASVILIDIPIGLVDRPGQLRPEGLLRSMLGKKHAAVFPVPCRQAVYAESDAQARKINLEVLGKSLSVQTLGIIPAIRQADTFLFQNPLWTDRFHESHPEFCFQQLNARQPILKSKLTSAGQRERLTVLQKVFPEAGTAIESFLKRCSAVKKRDDLIDAFVLAVTGQQILDFGACYLPENPESDCRGIPMRVTYASDTSSHTG